MSESVFKDQDITTDALPNPRRDQANEQEHSGDESSFKINLEEEDIPSFPQVQKNHSTSFSTRTKKSTSRKYSPSSASATIINISNSKDIHVGNKNTYNFNGSEKNKKTDIPETAAIRSLKASVQHLVKDDLLFAASHMDSTWKDVARACNIGEGQISQFIADHHIHGMKEVIYQVLQDWYQNEFPDATVGRLCTILWENNQKDVVLRWTQRID